MACISACINKYMYHIGWDRDCGLEDMSTADMCSTMKDLVLETRGKHNPLAPTKYQTKKGRFPDLHETTVFSPVQKSLLQQSWHSWAQGVPD